MSQVKALAGRIPPWPSVPWPLYAMASPATKKRPSCGWRIVATGGVPARIVSGRDAVSLTPSEVRSWAVNCPADEYVCAGFAAVDVAPSPKVQRYVRGWPSGSAEPALEKLTVRGTGPAAGLAAAKALGGRFDGM